MAVTIKDIARVANVSHTTVSRALRGHPAISASTAARIRHLARELGYVPNTVARGLKTSRSGVLGVIVRRIVDPFFSEVLNGIEDVLQAEGLSLFLAASNNDPEREEAVVVAMNRHRVDGVIICSTRAGEEQRQQLEAFGVPTVLVNSQATQDAAQSVSHDDVYGCSQITRHLIELGHERIAYLGNNRAGRTTSDRLAGYREALHEAGIEPAHELVTHGENGRPEGGALGVAKLLALPEPPTAIVCYNDMMAIGAIQTLRRAGLRVPDDCSVTGFDDIELAAYVSPTLTTFNQPKYELGDRAARMMLQLLQPDGTMPTTAPNGLLLRGTLSIRESTAPPDNRPGMETAGSASALAAS